MFQDIHVFGVEHAINPSDESNLIAIVNELESLKNKEQLSPGDVVVLEGDILFLAKVKEEELGRYNFTIQYLYKLVKYLKSNGIRLYFLTPEYNLLDNRSNRQGKIRMSKESAERFRQIMEFSNQRGIQYPSQASKASFKKISELGANIGLGVQSFMDQELFVYLCLLHYYNRDAFFAFEKKITNILNDRLFEEYREHTTKIEDLFKKIKESGNTITEDLIADTPELIAVFNRNYEAIIKYPDSLEREVREYKKEDVNFAYHTVYKRNELMANNFEELLKRISPKKIKAVIVGKGHLDFLVSYLNSKRFRPIPHSLVTSEFNPINDKSLLSARKRLIKERIKSRKNQTGFKEWVVGLPHRLR